MCRVDQVAPFVVSAKMIADDDPAYAYDRNPNSIAESAINVTLPVSPTVAATATCLPKGTIGVLKNGVALFAPVDAGNRDAVATTSSRRAACGAGPWRVHNPDARWLDRRQ